MVATRFIECRGNILDSEADVITIPVNCVGIMGAGLAKQAADHYKNLLKDYRSACGRHELEPGKVFAWRNVPTRQIILCVATKNHWKDNSELEWVENGVYNILTACYETLAHSIAIPKIGCGLGGLSYDDVRPIIVEAFTNNIAEVYLY